MARIYHARLSTSDAEELAACLKRLDAIHDSVQATGMAGKMSIMEQCVEVYRAIERVLRKEYQAVARAMGAQATETAQDPAWGGRDGYVPPQGPKDDPGEEEP